MFFVLLDLAFDLLLLRGFGTGEDRKRQSFLLLRLLLQVGDRLGEAGGLARGFGCAFGRRHPLNLGCELGVGVLERSEHVRRRAAGL